MSVKVDYVRSHDVVLVHENEKAIYGEHGRDCLDLMESIKSPKLRTALPILPTSSKPAIA